MSVYFADFFAYGYCMAMSRPSTLTVRLGLDRYKIAKLSLQRFSENFDTLSFFAIAL